MEKDKQTDLFELIDKTLTEYEAVKARMARTALDHEMATESTEYAEEREIENTNGL